VDPAAVLLLGGDHDDRLVETTLKEAQASVDLPETALAVLVLGVLAPVAVGGRRTHLRGDARALLGQQAPQLLMHALGSGAGQVVLATRTRRGAGGLLLFVGTHALHEVEVFGVLLIR